MKTTSQAVYPLCSGKWHSMLRSLRTHKAQPSSSSSYEPGTLDTSVCSPGCTGESPRAFLKNTDGQVPLQHTERPTEFLGLSAFFRAPQMVLMYSRIREPLAPTYKGRAQSWPHLGLRTGLSDNCMADTPSCITGEEQEV